VSALNESPDGGVAVRGTIINKKVGLYAARLVAAGKLAKDIKAVGPGYIVYDSASGLF